MALEAYRATRYALRGAISQAKARAWDELLEKLDRDSWGRPYKLVTKKLRPATHYNGVPESQIFG